MKRYFYLLIILFIIGCSTPTITSYIANTPTPKSKSIIPEGFSKENETSVGIKIARPNGWQRNIGKKNLQTSNETVFFVTYSFTSIDEIYLISIQYMELPFPEVDMDQYLNQFLGFNQSTLSKQNVRIYEKLSNITIDSQPAAGMMYRLIDPRKNALFSIIILLKNPKGYANIVQWTSKEKDQLFIKDIFYKMYPTIEFIR